MKRAAPLWQRALEGRALARERLALLPRRRGPKPKPRPPGTRRCSRCWDWKPYPEAFIGARGVPIGQCSECRAKYAGWASKSPEERRAVVKKGIPALPTLRARLVPVSQNKKLGGIPSSMTSRGTCPPSCGLYGAGCYAETHILGHHWRGVGEKGERWPEFCRDVAGLPEGQLWRHNVAGDLPGQGERIDFADLERLLEANRGKRGFTFTHKHRRLDNLSMIRRANAAGFTINLSADSLEHADWLADMRVAPVAVVLPHDAPIRLRTPAGRRVVICPAERGATDPFGEAITCASCELCAIPEREAIVGFRAHGVSKYLVSDLVQLRRKEAVA